MAKKTMKMNYKPAKRVRKNKEEESYTEIEGKNILKTVCIVIITICALYLCVLGMEKLGVFEAGYTKPETEETTIDYEFIDIGTVFNRDTTTYYVIFDNYESDYTKDAYIDSLLSSSETKVYKVDMSKKENEKYIASEGNSKVQKVSDLKINGITLMKVSKGKNVKYVEGSDKIEEYLK